LAEIKLFSTSVCQTAAWELQLEELILNEEIFRIDDLYTLQNDYNIISRRRRGNLKAKQLLETADKAASFISAFPFVKGIAVSGSLSKNYADDTSDIDFFIITQKNRLWIARTLLHCMKKLSFLFNKQQLFCMNYFIDEAALEIEEQNLYTATEVATLLPVRGITIFDRFYKANTWTRNHLPNHSMRISYVKEINQSYLKAALEFFLDNPLGNMLDNIFMKITGYRWSKKTEQGKLNSRGILMGMKTGKHYAKPDPRHFQVKLLDLFEKRSHHVVHSGKSNKTLADLTTTRSAFFPEA
jgi:predicted nucleotidyltransferase